MPTTSINRTINAPVEVVFETVSDIANFAKAVPHIVKVEFLTEQKAGAGTRFRETRIMGKRKATAELEVTEFVQNERVRLRSDSGGAVWDSLFTLTPTDDGAGTHLRLVMESRPYRLLSRLLVPLMTKEVGKAVASDMDAVKAYCESDQPCFRPTR